MPPHATSGSATILTWCGKIGCCSITWMNSSNHCSTASHLVSGVEQPIDCRPESPGNVPSEARNCAVPRNHLRSEIFLAHLQHPNLVLFIDRTAWNASLAVSWLSSWLQLGALPSGHALHTAVDWLNNEE